MYGFCIGSFSRSSLSVVEGCLEATKDRECGIKGSNPSVVIKY
jgi:hypothetical protein